MVSPEEAEEEKRKSVQSEVGSSQGYLVLFKIYLFFDSMNFLLLLLHSHTYIFYILFYFERDFEGFGWFVMSEGILKLNNAVLCFFFYLGPCRWLMFN